MDEAKLQGLSLYLIVVSLSFGAFADVIQSSTSSESQSANLEDSEEILEQGLTIVPFPVCRVEYCDCTRGVQGAESSRRGRLGGTVEEGECNTKRSCLYGKSF